MPLGGPHAVKGTLYIDGIPAPAGVEEMPLPELCAWITDKGGPATLLITAIFEMVDSYLFSAPLTGYSFIPTLQDVFGVIDYYLGFNGDPSTGCTFFT